MTTIGTSDLDVLPIALGANTFGWTADTAATFNILDAFLAGGGSLVDTADAYSAFAPGNHGGESETLIGEWIAAGGARDRGYRRARRGAVTVARPADGPRRSRLTAGDDPQPGRERRPLRRRRRASRSRLTTAWLRITVADHGPGVPAGEREAVFGRFNRGSQRGRALPAAAWGSRSSPPRRDSHGGRVVLEDTPGRRNDVRTVTLPR